MSARAMAIRVLSVFLASAFPLIASVTSRAATTTGKIEVTPSTEAWYNEPPPCVGFIDCSALPPSSPYPEDTLHVALSGGEETARTYLEFPLSLPLGAVLDEGILTLPVDTEPANGSVTPEQADFVACLSSTKFEATRGSFEKPPDIKCEVRKSGIYSEKRAVFEVDLSRFIEEWDTSKVALALVPSPKALEGTGTWHVVFPAMGPETDDPPEPGAEKDPITATFRYTVDEDAEDAIGTEFDFTTEGAAPPPSTGGASSDFGSSSLPGFDQSAPIGGTGSTADTGVPGPVAAADASAPQAAQPVAAFLEGFAGRGFAYPVIWALPLLLLVGLGAIGRSLTKDLYLADD